MENVDMRSFEGINKFLCVYGKHWNWNKLCIPNWIPVEKIRSLVCFLRMYHLCSHSNSRVQFGRKNHYWHARSMTWEIFSRLVGTFTRPICHILSRRFFPSRIRSRSVHLCIEDIEFDLHNALCLHMCKGKAENWQWIAGLEQNIYFS
jgi:hypothetical protein